MRYPEDRKSYSANLSLNVMNRLRALSQGEHAISANDLADVILKERVPNPKKGIQTLMRAEVYQIVKDYFPHAKPETPIKLGDGRTSGPSQTSVKIKMVDKTALVLDLLKFIKECGDAYAFDPLALMPEELLDRIKELAK